MPDWQGQDRWIIFLGEGRWMVIGGIGHAHLFSVSVTPPSVTALGLLHESPFSIAVRRTGR